MEFVGEVRATAALKVFTSLFPKKRPPIQRAERWSPPQRRNSPIVRKRHRREISSLWLEIGNPHKWGGSPFDAKAILIVCRFSFVTAGAKEKLTKENAVGRFASAEATNAPRVGSAVAFLKKST